MLGSEAHPNINHNLNATQRWSNVSSLRLFVSSSLRLFVPAISILSLVGCNVPVSRNQEFDTAVAKVTRLGTVYAPLGSQNFSATYYSETGPRVINGVTVNPSGDMSPVNGITLSSDNSEYTSSINTGWPTSYHALNMYTPANWTLSFTPTNVPGNVCYDPTTPTTASAPYPTLPSTQSFVQELDPGVGIISWEFGFDNGFFLEEDTLPGVAHPVQFTCYINTQANPQISQSGVLPRFVLDDALPSAVQVAALSQIKAAPANTFLHLFSSDLQQFTGQAATSVASDGMSAVFPYPTGINNAALPAGSYIGTITTDVPGQTETTNAMEPFIIGHDGQTYPGAFGVAFAGPKAVTTGVSQPVGSGKQRCSGSPSTINSTVGFSGPIVTSITQNKLLLPTNTSIAVGSSPTFVLPINYTTDSKTVQIDSCSHQTTQYSGPQSALVVNTASGNVSVVEIGQESFPQGTIAVGQQPVAAALGPNNLVYVANYGSGTISEINTSSLTQTRTLPVMQHPTTVAFDSTGNLWVGGQGFVDKVSISNWVVSSSTPVDGTVNGMVYAPTQGAMVQVILQNGTVGHPVTGGTNANPISFSSSQSSYSTVNVLNASTLSSSGPTMTATSNGSYTQSTILPYLAFPAQTAFVPPTMTSQSGDIVAVAVGNTFTISHVPTGEQLLSGTVPYAIRGVAVGTTAVYFTMTESNSVVTVPINLQ